MKLLKTDPISVLTNRTTISTGADSEVKSVETVMITLVNEGMANRQWYFVASTKNQGSTRRVELIRTPASTVVSPTLRLKSIEYKSNQSGRETGHRDLVFYGTISNSSELSLAEAHVYILYYDVSVASISLGELKSSEERSFQCSFKDGCIPRGELPAAYTERGSFRLRVVYYLETAYGNWWAEDLGYA